MSKPWEAEGTSRATWYRKRKTEATETVPETETAPETVPETTQPAADATTLYEMPADFSELQRRDAERYEAGGWGARARALGWTAIQQDRLVRQIAGREIKHLTEAQALVGTKIYYRFQLHHT